MTWQREGRLRSDKSASFVVEFVPRLRSSSFLVFLLGVSFFFPFLILQLDVGSTILNGSCKLAWGCCRKSKFNAGCLTAQGNSSSREVLGRLEICRNEMRSARVRDRDRSGNENPNTR